jgi:hypothetical protein
VIFLLLSFLELMTLILKIHINGEAYSAAAMVENTNQASAAMQNSESLVQQAITKRLRNARKRLRGIDEIQAKVDANETLNSDQASSMNSEIDHEDIS